MMQLPDAEDLQSSADEDETCPAVHQVVPADSGDEPAADVVVLESGEGHHGNPRIRRCREKTSMADAILTQSVVLSETAPNQNETFARNSVNPNHPDSVPRRCNKKTHSDEAVISQGHLEALRLKSATSKKTMLCKQPPKKRRYTPKCKISREGKKPCISIWSKIELFKETKPT